MSLLTICQEAAKTAGFNAPSSIIGNSDMTAVRLLAAAQREGKVLSRMPWKVLIKEHTFSTADGTAAYDLPADFRFFINETMWNRTEKDRVLGPESPQEWQYSKSGLVTTKVFDTFRIKADTNEKKLFLDPTPSDIETIAFEYIGDGWCQSSGGAAQTEWQDDTDTGVLDEFLLELGTTWRFMKMYNLPYVEEKMEYEREMMKAFGRDGGKRDLNLARGNRFDPLTTGNLPDSGYGT